MLSMLIVRSSRQAVGTGGSAGAHHWARQFTAHGQADGAQVRRALSTLGQAG